MYSGEILTESEESAAEPWCQGDLSLSLSHILSLALSPLSLPPSLPPRRI